MMNRFFHSFFLVSLPVASAVALAQDNRATFGVVGEDLTPALRVYVGAEQGVLVKSVWPGSPAEKSGVKRGDVIVSVDGAPVQNRESMAELLRRRRAGERVRAVLSYGGNLREVEVELLPRPKFPASGHHTPAAAVGGDRMHRPVVVSDEIRLRFLERRRNICRLLSSLPASLDKDAVVDELQAIRDLARDANPGNAGWMVGRAGVAAVQFRDSQGILLLRGADNQLTLEVFDSAGKMVLRCGLNGAEDYRALPADVLKRLLAL